MDDDSAAEARWRAVKSVICLSPGGAGGLYSFGHGFTVPANLRPIFQLSSSSSLSDFCATFGGSGGGGRGLIIPAATQLLGSRSASLRSMTFGLGFSVPASALPSSQLLICAAALRRQQPPAVVELEKLNREERPSATSCEPAGRRHIRCSRSAGARPVPSAARNLFYCIKTSSRKSRTCGDC